MRFGSGWEAVEPESIMPRVRADVPETEPHSSTRDRPLPLCAQAPMTRAALALLSGSALLSGAAGPAPPDLDVAVPPGSALEWTASFPAYTPPRRPLFPTTGTAAARADGERSSAPLARAETDVRFANAFGQVRILTWDLELHLEWMKNTVAPPVTGRGSLRPSPPTYGEPLYWLALAPLLRLLLHPDALVRSEVLAHVVELGEAALPVLAAASAERDLAEACRELRALVRVDLAPAPPAPAGASPRATALARIVLEECLRDEPCDPSDDFGRRLYLFAEEAEPLLRSYARHPSLTLARNAVAALGRYETRSAVECLAAVAAETDDAVTRVRALAALGRYRGPLDASALVARLERTAEPVQRAALVGALGRMGARSAAPALLALGERARAGRDSDLLISVLAALANVAWTRPEPELAAFAARVAAEAHELGTRSSPTVKADVPDSPGLRAAILRQLALLARSQALVADAGTAAEILALAQPAPLDARLSELGVGGTDPLGSIAPPARFLYLDGLLRAGAEGVARLEALCHERALETALRGRALALLPYDRRGALALAFLSDAATPVELRVQALEILIADVHPSAEAACRALLAREALGAARPAAGELFLTQRAVRFLSEGGKLGVRELLPLFPFVRHPVAEREQHAAEVRARVDELIADVLGGARPPEVEARAGGLFDFVLEHGLNPLFDASLRDTRVSALLQALRPLRERRKGTEAQPEVRSAVLTQLLGGEVQREDPGRTLFAPSVPLAEEVLLALGRARDPLALELLLSALESGAPFLRAHACLALGMCAQPAVAEKLLPALLDEDPFVRFAAAESLRHLTEKEIALDWVGAPSAERQRAAEEWRAWFLEAER
jgi:HEAT repeat protein